MRTRLLSGAGVAAVLGLALAALPALPVSAKGLSSSQIKSIENHLNHGKNITFSATYTAVSEGQKQTITVAQAPPKSYFGATTGAVIDTGKATYYCSATGGSGSTGGTGSSGSTGATGSTGSTGNTGSTTTTKAGTMQCLKESGASPLLGIEDLFSPATVLAVLNEAKEGLVARALGVHLTVSSGNYGGQSATCFSGTVRGKSGKYCVTNKGIIAYVSSGSNTYFELTNFSSKPSSSLFNLPAGATVETIPSSSDTSIP